jgi:hypothetical protein
VRGSKTYACNLPKFTPPPNAQSINVDREDLYDKFRKLSPKQRIAVLTVRDQNIVNKLYAYSNKVWCHQIQALRNNVGSSDDVDSTSRTFTNCFEYLFGESDDFNDSDHEDSQPLLGKRTVQSSIATVTNRPFNSTFSYGNNTPSVFKPKLNFITTKDVLKIMIDGSKDFCASKVRSRCRLLQRPEMWDRIFDGKEEVSLPEYESLMYQVLEFRVLFEYLNGGSGGEPFSNIKKLCPTDADKWARTEKTLVEMEEGSTASTAPATPAVSSEHGPLPVSTGPKKTRKQRLLEKIAAIQNSEKETAELPKGDPSSSEDEETENEKQEQTNKAVEPEALTASLQNVVPLDSDDDDWIEVGTASKTKKRVEPVADKAEKPSVTKPKYVLSEEHRAYKFKAWKFSDKEGVYVTDSVKASTCKTFVEVIPVQTKKAGFRCQECPF